MKPLICCMIFSMLSALSRADDTNAPGGTPLTLKDTVVFVIPVQGGITRTTMLIIDKGLKAAEDAGSTAIVLDMNTPGGRLDHTEKIMTALLETKTPTYTFVNTWAISAGAMIAFSTDHIYMKHSGLIGDAMPIMISPVPGQGVTQLPEDIKEKIVSPTEAMIRRAAQQKGHDPELAACMVRRELSYTIGDKEICREGQLLTLTATDAAQVVGEGDARRPLLSAGSVSDLDEMLTEAGLAGGKVIHFEVPGSIAFAQTLQKPMLSIIILGLGILLIYIEFKVPGFGVPGVSGICLIALWFWAHQVVGLAGLTELLVLGLGVGLLLLEIFVIPGFGVTGITGMILILAALLMAMIDVLPTHPPDVPHSLPINWEYVKQSLGYAITTLSTSLVLSFIGIVILARFLPKTHAFQRLMLMSSLDEDKGYRAAKQQPDLVGRTGTAESALRPAGIGVIGDARLNVVAKGEFVAKGQPIVVKEVHGSRIVVAPLVEREPAEPPVNRTETEV